MRDPYLHFYQVLCLPLWRTYILLLLRCRKMFSQFSCPTSRPRKLRFCFESIQSPFPISSDFDYGGRRRGGVEFSLAFQLNIRFFMAPFPAFNTLMTVLIHIEQFYFLLLEKRAETYLFCFRIKFTFIISMKISKLWCSCELYVVFYFRKLV